jgi:hypothetical protein
MALEWNDILEVSKKYNLEPCLIQAVFQVEAAGKSGFLPSGKPKILFEGHKFWAELKKRNIDPNLHLKNNPKDYDILYPKWTQAVKKFYLGGEKEYTRLDRAKAINEDAALCSASWGCFQIMGYHYKSLGYKTIQEFVEFIKIGEKEQLELFFKFITINNLFNYLKNKNWEKFTAGYNGSGQIAYYSGELKKAYSNCLIKHK